LAALRLAAGFAAVFTDFFAFAFFFVTKTVPLFVAGRPYILKGARTAGFHPMPAICGMKRPIRGTSLPSRRQKYPILIIRKRTEEAVRIAPVLLRRL
jgi:hypothetical protein